MCVFAFQFNELVLESGLGKRLGLLSALVPAISKMLLQYLVNLLACKGDV